jgi:ornithine cyclodeaminase
MPCARRGAHQALGAKLVTTFPGNSAQGLPGVSGIYAQFDPRNGRPIALIDAARLTLVRTAAVSALAARLLSKADARTLGIIGAGPQAEEHARAFAHVRSLGRVIVWARRLEAAEGLARRLRAVWRSAPARLKRIEVGATIDITAAAACDLVVTATGATAPLLPGQAVKDNAFVCAIGAHTSATRELDDTVVARASRVVVETLETLAEAGDLQIPAARGFFDLNRVETLAAVVTASPRRKGRRTPARRRGPVIFKSCGVAFEDLALATTAVEATLAFSRKRR